MKAIKVISVLALLVLFPAISYLYLMKGYNFRLGALQELETKAELEDFTWHPTGLAFLKDNASLVFDANHPQTISYLEPVYEEFSHRKEFQMLGFAADSTTLQRYPSGKEQWQTVIGEYPYDMSIALIDTSAHIRNYYGFDSTSFQKLIQHIPIIIPREKEKDIVLKREDEK